MKEVSFFIWLERERERDSLFVYRLICFKVRIWLKNVKARGFDVDKPQKTDQCVAGEIQLFIRLCLERTIVFISFDLGKNPFGP